MLFSFLHSHTRTLKVPHPIRWNENELLNFALGLKRLDITLTEEQARAFENYARAHARRFAIVLEAFAPLIHSNARIFSVGSMPNQIELLFAHHLNATVIGSTYSPFDQRDKFTAVYESAGGKRYEMDVYLRDLTCDALPMDSWSCDAVLCFEVIEHFLNSPQPLFGEIRRVLRPGGHLLLSTPNMQHWHRISSTLQGLTYPDLNFGEPLESRHTHIFSYRELAELLHATGFKVVEQFFADPWDHVRHLRLPKTNTLLERITRRLLTTHIEYQHECIFIAAQSPLDSFRLTSGWHKIERNGDNWLCWAERQGQIHIFVERNVTAIMRGELYSIQHPNLVEVLVNGDRQAALDIDWDCFRPFELTVRLSEGKNLIEFFSHNAPITLETDNRWLAVAVKNLYLVTDDHHTFQMPS